MTLTVETIVIWIIIGAVAGWLANLVVGGIRGGLLPTVLTGIIGSFVGGWILRQLNLAITPAGTVGDIVVAFIGAVVLLLVVRLIR